MKIPEFDEFWSTLDEEKMSEFFGESMLNIYQIDSSKEENISALVSKIAFDVSVRSANYSARLLRAYHEWFLEQLSQTDPQE